MGAGITGNGNILLGQRTGSSRLLGVGTSGLLGTGTSELHYYEINGLLVHGVEII